MKVIRFTAILLAIPLAASVFWATRPVCAQTASDKRNEAPDIQRSSSAQGNVILGQLPQNNWSPSHVEFANGSTTADPEMNKLHNEETNAERLVTKLVDQYVRAEGDAQRAKIKTDLSAALAKSFDLQQQRRSLELTHVEARLKKVREVMQKRSDARQTIIDKRLDQVLREAYGLGWTSPPGLNLSTTNRNPYSNSLAPLPLPPQAR
jgi:hypothetical protein